MIVKTARGHGAARSGIDRKKSKTGHRTRQYHAFGLALVVSGTGESFWRLIVGTWRSPGVTRIAVLQQIDHVLKRLETA